MLSPLSNTKSIIGKPFPKRPAFNVLYQRLSLTQPLDKDEETFPEKLISSKYHVSCNIIFSERPSAFS
jgi:hypothetical protein